MYWITYLQVTTLYFLFKKKSYKAISYYYYYYYFQEGIYFSFSFTQKIENKIEGMFDLITSLPPLVIRGEFFFFGRWHPISMKFHRAPCKIWSSLITRPPGVIFYVFFFVIWFNYCHYCRIQRNVFCMFIYTLCCNL